MYLCINIGMSGTKPQTFKKIQSEYVWNKAFFKCRYLPYHVDDDDIELILDQGSYSYSFSINLQKHSFNKQDTDTNRMVLEAWHSRGLVVYERPF